MQKRGFLVFFVVVYILISTSGICFANTEVTGAGADVTDTGTVEDAGRGAASRVPAPDISAPSALLMEAETGQILYEKNTGIPLHISAANKLMTV
ncbi:MAG TPA: hypothetical protein PK423_05145, partial [Clostridiales bacterium]|nr:hypothetical protein [Clostridiales bacterium]